MESSLGQNTSAEIELECEVDPVIILRRTDAGTINPFEKDKNTASFTVTANTYNGVDVNISSANDFYIQHKQNNELKIPYEIAISYGNSFKKLKDKRHKYIKQKHFSDGKCDFQLKFSASAEGHTAGQYSDHITINVVAHQ